MKKPHYSQQVIVSYIALILSYTQIYYDLQFDSRSAVYNQVVDNFYDNLAEYYKTADGVSGMPSVAFFAQKANLSPNYFGDLIKHFTKQSPIDHIQEFVLEIGKTEAKGHFLVHFRDIL